MKATKTGEKLNTQRDRDGETAGYAQRDRDGETAGYVQWDHGGDIFAYEMESGRIPLDFSASVNPLGIAEHVSRAAREALKEASFYPDPFCRKLRQALAKRLEVSMDRILCGNGASDLIWRLAGALRPKKALIPVPTFSEYEQALRFYGCKVQRYPLLREEGFLLTERFVDAITPETELVFLCQPNNPTGRTIAPGLLARILGKCQRTGCLLVVDECFLEFLEESEEYSLMHMLQAIHTGRGEGLLLLRAFTKFHGMAGLRLGYCLSSDPGLLLQMQKAGPPWSVSGVAQAAGIAALETPKEDASALRSLICQQRQLLAAGLAECGCEVIPGEANYLLFRASLSLGGELRKQGILLRDCSGFPGLGQGWYRAAIRTEADNRRLLEAVRHNMY